MRLLSSMGVTVSVSEEKAEALIKYHGYKPVIPAADPEPPKKARTRTSKPTE